MTYSNDYIDNVERQCTGKRGYNTKAHAKRAARRAERHIKTRVNAYRCPHCSLFHLGHRT